MSLTLVALAFVFTMLTWGAVCTARYLAAAVLYAASFIIFAAALVQP